jgi:hypothetical protein
MHAAARRSWVSQGTSPRRCCPSASHRAPRNTCSERRRSPTPQTFRERALRWLAPMGTLQPCAAADALRTSPRPHAQLSAGRHRSTRAAAPPARRGPPPIRSRRSAPSSPRAAADPPASQRPSSPQAAAEGPAPRRLALGTRVARRRSRLVLAGEEARLGWGRVREALIKWVG